MRILQVCEATGAGVGRHLIDLTRGLLGAGCEVHLLYSSVRMDRTFALALAALPKIRKHLVDMTRSPGPVDAIAVVRALAYHRRHGPFDVVHGHSSKGGAIARLVAAATFTPAIYTPHCISTMDPKLGPVARAAFSSIELGLSLLTQQVIVSSKDEHEHVLSLGVRRERVCCIPHGIELPALGSKREARAELGLPPDGVVVGFVGRLSEQKNPELLIRAFGRLAGTRPDVCLAIVGEGELEGSCRALASSVGVAERIHWLGFRSGAEAMPAFDVLAVPSRYEGFPYVMLEALAVGLPLVVTPVGGADAIVEDGVNGFVVAPNDEEAMHVALARLVDSEASRASFSRAARLRSANFRVQTMVDRTLGLYERVRAARALERSHGAPASVKAGA